MIILQDFSFGNFRSFKEIQTLSLSKANLTSVQDIALEPTHTFKYKEGAFLKTKAIYGANASGKSNVVKALEAFLKIVSDSVRDSKVLSLIDSFVSAETIAQPTFFQMIFYIDEVRYRYGFEAKTGKITSEWLYGKKGRRELCYFIREDNAINEIDKTNFAEGVVYMNLTQQGEDSGEMLLPTNLFLTVLASFGFGKISKQITSNLSSINIISGLSNPTMMSHATEALKEASKKEFILNILRKGDTSIQDLEVIEAEKSANFEEKKKPQLLVSKKEYMGGLTHGTFSFERYESEGTRKLFELSSYIYEAVKEGRPLVIDEFDARFHSLLTKRIVQLFNSEENKQTQFIFVTHDTSLLSSSFLRRDQIEFVEKDEAGASHLYSLAQINGIRAQASFEKDYRHGKYGAIPLVEDFSELAANS